LAFKNGNAPVKINTIKINNLQKFDAVRFEKIKRVLRKFTVFLANFLVDGPISVYNTRQN
jgi:hypothetical protein